MKSYKYYGEVYDDDYYDDFNDDDDDDDDDLDLHHRYDDLHDYHWPYDNDIDFYSYDYNYDNYEPEPQTWLDKVFAFFNHYRWILESFWLYTLKMYRCPGCGQYYRFGNHDDCLPF